MKTSLLAVLVLAAAGITLPAAAAQKEVVLLVPTMNCSACPITVRKALEKVAGVQNVKASLEPPEATKNAGYPSSVKGGS